MEELIRKYELKSETLIKIIQHKESTKDEILRASVARRFVVGFIEDLKREQLKIIL